MIYYSQILKSTNKKLFYWRQFYYILHFFGILREFVNEFYNGGLLLTAGDIGILE